MSDPRKFWSCGNVLDVLYHTFTDAKFGGYRNSPAVGAAKNVEFVCVCVCVRHAFERQSLCARFRHEGVNDFDALVCSCAVYMHPYSTLSDCRQLATPQNAEVLKTEKFGFYRCQRVTE